MPTMREFPQQQNTQIQQDVSRFLDGVKQKTGAEHHELLNQILREKITGERAPNNLTPQQISVRSAIQNAIDNDPKVKKYLAESRNVLDTRADTFLKDLKDFNQLKRQETISSLNAAFEFTNLLGQVTKDKTLQQVGTLGQSAMLMYKGYTALTTALASSAPVLGALGPIGIIGMGAITLFSMFSKKKSSGQNDPFPELLMKHLSFISAQLFALQEAVGVVLQNQKQIYESIWKAYGLLDKLIKDEINNFRASTEASLARLEQLSLQIFDFVRTAANATYWHEFEKMVKSSQDFARKSFQDKRFDLDKAKEYQSEMMCWINPNEHRTINPILNDQVLFANHARGGLDNLYANIVATDRLSFNYLMRLAEETLKVSLEEKAPEAPDMQLPVPMKSPTLPNPEGVMSAGSVYWDFRRSFAPFSQELDPGNQSVEQVLEASKEIQQTIRALQKKPDLFQKLFALYKSTILDLTTLTQNEMKRISPEINSKIAEVENKCVSEIKAEDRVVIDVQHSLEDLLLRVKSKSALHAIKGDTFRTHLRSFPANVVTIPYEDIKQDILTYCAPLFAEWNLAERLELGNLEFSFCAFPGLIETTIKFTYKDKPTEPEHIKLVHSTTAPTNEVNSQSDLDRNNHIERISHRERLNIAIGRSVPRNNLDVKSTMKNFWANKTYKSISYSKNVDQLKNVMEGKLKNHLLPFRKKAINNLFQGDAGVAFNTLLTKVQAIVLLMKSYSRIIGLREEECQKIDRLPNKESIKHHFLNYIQTGQYDTPLTDIAPELPQIEAAIMAKFREFNPANFKSDLLENLSDLDIRFNVLKNIPEPAPSAAPNASTARAEEKRPEMEQPPASEFKESAPTSAPLESNVMDNLQEIFQRYVDNQPIWQGDYLEQKDIEGLNSSEKIIYQKLKDNLSIQNQLIETITKLFSLEHPDTLILIKQLKKLNECSRNIHNYLTYFHINKKGKYSFGSDIFPFLSEDYKMLAKIERKFNPAANSPRNNQGQRRPSFFSSSASNAQTNSQEGYFANTPGMGQSK